MKWLNTGDESKLSDQIAGDGKSTNPSAETPDRLSQPSSGENDQGGGS